jgi:hypothetical protein
MMPSYISLFVLRAFVKQIVREFPHLILALTHATSTGLSFSECGTRFRVEREKRRACKVMKKRKVGHCQRRVRGCSGSFSAIFRETVGFPDRA